MSVTALVRVGVSSIAGHGLFAAAAMPPGCVVLAGDGAAGPIDGGQVNHSCDPNLGWAGESVVTTREVAAGEELVIDYATCVEDPDFLLRCHCETYRCRQMVAGDDWRIPQLQRRYAGHWSPRLQARIAAGR